MDNNVKSLGTKYECVLRFAYFTLFVFSAALATKLNSEQVFDRNAMLVINCLWSTSAEGFYLVFIFMLTAQVVTSRGFQESKKLPFVKVDIISNSTDK